MLLTSEWRDSVRAELRRRKWTQEHLAELAGCSPSNISQMLNPRQATSVWVDPVARVLGLPPPEMVVDGGLLARLVQAVRELEDAAPDLAEAEVSRLELLARMAKSRNK